ncbi:50S ribosomal protein L16 [Candidatus Pacearchaeota archaeon]|nr:MAG: 50S ribosomal protein L16 [Candidatus Pacearchaeota archaeon]
MALRKASAYSKRPARPYTRKSNKKSKAYIKTIPQNRIVKFNMGDQRAFLDGKHACVLRLVADEDVQIRDNALEAARLLINKSLDKLAQGNYFFAVKVYPHHILRENKAAGGQAGADRLSTGMKHSFGVTIGRAAIVKRGKEILFVSCTNENIARNVRKVLEKAKAKFPCRTKIVFEKLGS